MRFDRKQGDTGPPLTAMLKGDGAPQDLTGASVVFRMRKGATLKSGSASITNPSGGGVSYTFAAGDLADPGRYKAEFEVTFAGGVKVSFPNRGYISGYVWPELD